MKGCDRLAGFYVNPSDREALKDNGLMPSKTHTTVSYAGTGGHFLPVPVGSESISLYKYY